MTMPRVRCRVLLGAAMLLLSGCVMGPNYRRRDTTPVPAAWRDTSSALRDSSLANLPWWSVLGDTTLQGLVRTALQENRDLHIAVARVNEARAQLGIQRLERYPQIDVEAGVVRSSGADSLLSGVGAGRRAFLGTGLSWELDLWGRMRRLNESALALLLATEQARRGVILSVVSEVARAYLELRDLDAQVAIAGQQIDIRRQSLTLARARFRGGLTSELDVRQGENAHALAEGTQERALRERRQKENELSVLVGRPPANMPRGLPLADQPFPDSIPAGLPSDLLTRRPDVRRAEEEVRAANARIGAAIAALFPTISLTGLGGTVSDQLTSLFERGSKYWRIGADAVQPVLDHRRSKFHVDAERARTEAAVGEYERTVLTAFREVEDGLVAVRRLHAEVAAAARAATAARQAVRLAALRYEGGVDSYLSLLDAQRAQLDAELRESELRREHRVSVVQLYKALGGGWDPVTDSLAMPRPAVRR